MKRANDWPDERRRFGRGVSGLLEDGWALSAPVFRMVGGIAAVASANHERLRERVEALEKRLAQREWRGGIKAPWNR